MANKIYDINKEFWKDKEDSILPNTDEKSLDKYAKEIVDLVGTTGYLLDAGCGAGEVTCSVSKYVDKIMGIDYSEKMIDVAKRRSKEMKVDNVIFKTLDLIEIQKIENEQFDAVYSSGVIQYLSFMQTSEFVKNALKLVRSGGKLVLMNIPNVVFKDIYHIGVFHQNAFHSFSKYIKGYIHYKLRENLKRLKNPSKYDDGIGNWYLMSDFEKMVKDMPVEIDLMYSKYPPFGYRFHVTLTKNG